MADSRGKVLSLEYERALAIELDRLCKLRDEAGGRGDWDTWASIDAKMDNLRLGRDARASGCGAIYFPV